MKKVMYTSIWVYDKDGITVLFPALPGCITCGRSDADTKLMAEDALKEWCESMLEQGNELPEDLKLVDLSRWVCELKANWKRNKWVAKSIHTEIEEK